jgi:hypothetical protein
MWGITPHIGIFVGKAYPKGGKAIMVYRSKLPEAISDLQTTEYRKI